MMKTPFKMKPGSLITAFILFCFVSSFAQHPNILIDDNPFNYPNEPSIKIDPSNTKNLVAGSNINNFYYSKDGGFTWKSGKLNSPYGVWGDPSFAVDTYGNFYFFHLANPAVGNWIDRIVCQKTADVGQSWTSGSYMGLNGTKAQDKEWPIVDRSNNFIYVTWTEFDKYGSSASADSSKIMFSRSVDGGESWSTAKRINEVSGDCIDDDFTVEGAVPALGPEGEIYVAWSGPEGIIFDRSLDRGNSWLDSDIFVTEHPGGWNYDVPGISRCNGLPVTVCDTSSSAFRGSIYINWTDQRNGPNDTDVWIIKSTDGGDTWGEPIRVNNDGPGKHQFFSWMDIDQTNGYIYVVFYDRRNHSDNYTDVYLAVSTDGGASFSNHLISENPFLPNKGIFFGDYTNITVYNNVVRPIWTHLHSGELKLYTALVDVDFLLSNEDDIPYSHTLELDQNYPNPFSSETFISFKLHKPEILDLTIYDNNGNIVSEIFNQKPFDMGKHVIRVSDQAIDFSDGVYYYILRSGDGFFMRKMIQMD